MKKIAFIIVLILLFSIKAKSSNIDSLISVLPSLNDSGKISILFNLSRELTYQEPLKSKKYVDEALAILKKTNDTLSTFYARFHTQLGVLEKNKGNFNEAAIYQHIALKIHEQIGEPNNRYKASVYNDLGIIYKTLQNWSSALNYYKKSNQLCKELDLLQGVLMTYNNIGTVLIQLNETDSAQLYYNKAYDLSLEMEDLYGQALTLNNLGELLVTIGDSKGALKKFEEALKMDRLSGDRFGIVSTLINLGTLEQEMGKISDAEKHLKEGVEIAKQQEAKLLIAQTQKSLSLIYESQNNFKNAYFSLKESEILNDSIFNEEKNKQITELEAKYQNEKKQQEIELQQAKLNEQDAALEKKKVEKKLYIYVIIFGILIILILIYGWNLKRKDNDALSIKNIEIEQQRLTLEEKNIEITDSIHYAKRIQSAILPPQKIVKEYLQKSFILYKPKDIVAGDFYWLEHKENKVLFAACDCTGHGVPGAMVSVVCNNGLNRSVRENGLTDPAEILNKTREIVIEEFEKSEDDVKDGMDIALCSLEGNTLKYAGANNPLWIIRKDATEVEEIKADKQPIGKYSEPQPYTTHTIELNEGDTIYIFSDGYADQFGGEKGKKLKTVNFKKLLLSIQKEDIEKQRELIDKSFEEWKGNLDQLDDICVIGVRI
ncbi:tetratricopeptide repeat protein [Vicingus serpentipes]|uniref:Tetratricopeptide repeat protein n=1 Tax=Vicingus serpentipes TaxID=1926625 RepID=A0A5C6RWY9_9FLAO|nr:tetratricopeptide repeat protein [Vicingus serpentipes]TXB66878.1 tetratricopeptide repeat protein [Vicingus serpentipes]